MWDLWDLVVVNKKPTKEVVAECAVISYLKWQIGDVLLADKIS